MPGPLIHATLKIEDVQQLGRVLIDISNRYPTKFLTERDFFPLVVTYLTGRLPAVIPEVASSDGVIDFHLKGTNPTWLELAVQPRQIIDPNLKSVVFPGHTAKTSLYASQNRSELKKLMNAPTGKTRFLLLVDLIGSYDPSLLQTAYQAEGAKNKGGKSIRVVYSGQDSTKDCNFNVKGHSAKRPSSKQ